VRYFTATIKSAPGKDPHSPQRQQIYLRALRALPHTTVHLGKFRIDKRVMVLHPTEFDDTGRPRTVTVKKMEEKGSDVSLASCLLLDAFTGDSDLYAVLSNDSDLVTPLRMVRNELGRDTGLLTPVEPKRASNELKQTLPILHRAADIATVKLCQLPDALHDETGVITRPPKWAQNSKGPAEAGPSNQ